MRARLTLSLLSLAALATPAAADPSTTRRWLTGDVVRADGRWSGDGSRIVTDATIRTIDGETIVVSQLGGSAGGYTQVIWHGQPALEPGLRVRVAATRSPVSGRWHTDEVLVEDGPGRLAPSVRTVTKKSGKKLYWAKSCIEVRRDALGTDGVEGEDAIVTASIAAWNDGIAACSYLNLVEGAAEDREVGNDRVNLITFRDTEWCRPAVDGDPARCFSAAAAGVTTVTFVDDPDDERDGEIIDADIELNNVTFNITHEGQGTGMQQCDADLANTLVHELGHLLGLEHTCRANGDPARVDHTGASVPLCSETTDPIIHEATMYPFHDCGETLKATPEADDLQAICTTYPTADDPVVCAPPDELVGTCCSAGGGVPTGYVALALLVFAALSARPRRSAPRRSPGRPSRPSA